MKKRIILSLITMNAVAMMSCKKSDPVVTPPQPHTVVSINPSDGPKNTIVSIKGTRFGNNASDVKVVFNTTQAIIQTINDSVITAAVPVNAGTGAVKVEKNSVQITGPVFTYRTNGWVGTPDFGGIGNAMINPSGITKDAAGNMFICERGRHRIVKITTDGVASVFAGGTAGFTDGTGSAAQFRNPYAITIDPSGNLFVADWQNHAIRKITSAGVVTTIAGNGVPDFANGTGSTARFNQPCGITIDASGNLYIADYINAMIRKITPAGVVTTLVNPSGGIFGVVSDAAGNIYYTSYMGQQVRKYTTAGSDIAIAGLINTTGTTDGTGTAARFNYPAGITLDASGNIYITESINSLIRKITPGGVVTTIAGIPLNSSSQDGQGTAASFGIPIALYGDFSNNALWIADLDGNRIRKMIIE